MASNFQRNDDRGRADHRDTFALDEVIEDFAERFPIVPVATAAPIVGTASSDHRRDTPIKVPEQFAGQTAGQIVGRILSADVINDRDSPAADVSAMDGFAIASGDIDRAIRRGITITGEAAAGMPRQTMTAGRAMRIFTGAIVPRGADLVVKVEDADVAIDAADGDAVVRLHESLRPDGVAAGRHIRRRGENAIAGDVVVPAGTMITPPVAAAMAGVGLAGVGLAGVGLFGDAMNHQLRRRVRVAILTTGDEVIPPQSVPEPHQIRNTNAAAVAMTIGQWSAIDVETFHASDSIDGLRTVIADLCRRFDFVVITGGVSMGDHDYVPKVVESLGGEIVFHRLPIRPGKPVLGAVMGGDRVTGVIGLPGNPVSSTIGAVRMVMPCLRRIAGMTHWRTQPASVRVRDVGSRTLPLTWFRAVRIDGDGWAECLPTRGSGDLFSIANSDGFIEIPAGNALRDGDHARFFRW